ncbi:MULTISPECIES: Arm DNA-binding domain-containing protein [Klebsiella]|uniref:Arm DNA-binding domain-containing protein n=1 Tax=Klebsiella TaxID=570 RepID=UPI000650F4F4|nr:Arm DNA-binding domain-containing protein [Klebsiella variicola]
MKLNARQVDAAKPREKAYKLADGAGLYLEVVPSGSRYWRMKMEGRREMMQWYADYIKGLFATNVRHVS